MKIISKFKINHSVKCDYCGHFIAYKDLIEGGATQIKFIPYTEFTAEESGWICPKCSDEEEEFYLNGNKN